MHTASTHGGIQSLTGLLCLVDLNKSLMGCWSVGEMESKVFAKEGFQEWGGFLRGSPPGKMREFNFTIIWFTRAYPIRAWMREDNLIIGITITTIISPHMQQTVLQFNITVNDHPQQCHVGLQGLIWSNEFIGTNMTSIESVSWENKDFYWIHMKHISFYQKNRVSS